MKKTSKLKGRGPPWSNCGVHHGPWTPPWLSRSGH